jgi:hypothetical protein
VREKGKKKKKKKPYRSMVRSDTKNGVSMEIRRVRLFVSSKLENGEKGRKERGLGGNRVAAMTGGMGRRNSSNGEFTEDQYLIYLLIFSFNPRNINAYFISRELFLYNFNCLMSPAVRNSGPHLNFSLGSRRLIWIFCGQI